MKKLLITLLFAGTVLINSGCDVIDSFESLPLNIPISLEIDVSGNSNQLSETQAFCLSWFPEFQEYQDDINDLNFVEASFRTSSFSPSDLRGNLMLELKDDDGNTIFMNELNNVSPADFAESPYIIQLTESELDLMNSYLDSDGGLNSCFTGVVSLEVTQGAGNKSLVGIVDIVFEAETSID